jgi:aryl-alcohol dehydrogenase-like predicted oxidoreductase
MAVVPWSPLAGGFLTGKYKRDDTADTGRLSGANPFGQSKFADRNWAILDVLRAVATEHERPPAQIALAWTLARPGVASTIIGASKVAQLDDNLAALDLTLSDEQMARLNQASATAPGFSDALVAPGIRRMVFGGHDVRGWGE